MASLDIYFDCVTHLQCFQEDFSPKISTFPIITFFNLHIKTYFSKTLNNLSKYIFLVTIWSKLLKKNRFHSKFEIINVTNFVSLT